MPGRDDAARPERRGKRRGESLGEREQLGAGARCGSAVAGDDCNPPSARQQRRRAFDVALVGDRPVYRDAARLQLDDRRLGGLAKLDRIALVAVEIEMGRARRIGQGGAPGVAQQARQFGRRVDRG